jgi:hypothetical protein
MFCNVNGSPRLAAIRILHEEIRALVELNSGPHDYTDRTVLPRDFYRRLLLAEVVADALHESGEVVERDGIRLVPEVAVADSEGGLPATGMP